MLLRPPSVDTAGAISTETGGGGTLTHLPAERDGFVIGFTVEGEHERLLWKSCRLCGPDNLDGGSGLFVPSTFTLLSDSDRSAESNCTLLLAREQDCSEGGGAEAEECF